jgi:hypothetical protein
MPMRRRPCAKADCHPLLEAEGVALDIGAYRDAPAGLAYLVRRHR